MPGAAYINFNNFGKLAARAPEAVGKIVEATAYRVQAKSQQSMAGGKHGRLYRRGSIGKTVKTGGRAFRAYESGGFKGKPTKGGKTRFTTGYKVHRASAPGEAPAIDTGHLVNSFRVRMKDRTTAIVEVRAEQAAALEFGTGRIAARPYLRPALEKENQEMIAQLMTLESRLA